MKYVITWRALQGGSAADNEAAAERALQLFSKWSPAADATFHQFVERLDGTGGFAVVETDNPLSVLDGPSKFGTLFEFKVDPVIDIMESIPTASEGVEFRQSIS
jgi:hypothetical protein